MSLDGPVGPTEEFARLIAAPQPHDLEWCAMLDRAFLDAAFLYDPEKPFQYGPDGLAYFTSRLPEEGKLAVRPRDELDHLIEWVAGWRVLRADGTVVWVYWPGDLVALKLYGRILVVWEGGWAKPPDRCGYASGGMVWEGRPNPEMLPPLAARSLEFGLRTMFAKTPKLAERVPAIKLVRPANREGPDEASDLSINLWAEDLDNDAVRMQRFLDRACAHLPRHLGNRVISGFGPGGFTPLRAIVEDGGLRLAPDR